MSIEVAPAGVRCNLKCVYCYQEPMREAGAFGPKADVLAMIRTLEKQNASFSVFGGEALLTPIETLEELWRFGFERFGRNGVQTNGSLITDAHLDLFRRYRVSVGLSIDGPDELNDARWTGTLEGTRAATKRSCDSIFRMLRAGIGCSLIVTLHRLNASAERLPRLLSWLRELHAAGLRNMRAHILEVDSAAAQALVLSDEENLAAFEALRPLRELVQIDVFEDIYALLRGVDGKATCTWSGCDPWTTPAVQGVDADGTSVNCGRVNKDGVDWRKAETHGMHRQLVLASTPQADGGCAGCKFLVFCKGQCPGEAVDGDWRNRSRYCRVWYSLFERVEAELVAAGEIPVTRRADFAKVEAAMLAAWERDHRSTVEQAIRAAESGSQAGSRKVGIVHADVPHGDHEDHGDHVDLSSLLSVFPPGERV
jgi:uncharacterized protein